MGIKRRMAFLCFLALFATSLSHAETVEFPEDELATETVLPVFEKVRSVLSRTVDTTERFELGGGAGMALNEPFYNPVNFGANGTYHFTDQHAANISGTFFMSGLTQYGKQLRNGEGLTADQFDPNKAPAPKWMLLGNYQFTAYYGKISLSKQANMNLSLFGVAGGGVLMMGGIACPAIDVGFGQNFYMSKNAAVRFDLKLVMFNGPDATSLRLDNSTPAPDEGNFSKDWFFKTFMSLGLVFLL